MTLLETVPSSATKVGSMSCWGVAPQVLPWGPAFPRAKHRTKLECSRAGDIVLL